MVVAGWITIVRDFGIPTLLGGLVAAWVTHRLSVGRLLLQDERAAATATDQSLSQLELRAYGGPASAGQLRQEWSAGARPHAVRINSPELLTRVELVGKMLLLAHQSHERDESWRHAVGLCIEDARVALSAYLNRKALPPAIFSQDADIQRMTGEGLDTLFERINAQLA